MTPERWQKIEELYHAARERRAEERVALLEGIDPDLRQEIESLLAQESAEFPSLLPLSVSRRIATGTMFGAYRIQEPIGEGGMGEVYRAQDTKLGRDVAIKVLPEQFVRDADRLARFEREARLLAHLNHPNIAAIHGLEEAGGAPFLVMELVPGETLQERLKKDGPFSIEEALEIVSQICEALEHAHEKGIIHRDLKPANIKLTPDGKVKVLDFGLAKAFAGDGEQIPLDSNSPTLGAAATAKGMILGTAAYMSPEQAKGKTVDRRADIWALGCVLYELMTGKQAFEGENVTEVLASVLKGEPDWSLLPGSTPPPIRSVLRRCLRKEVQQRAKDAGDIRLEIEESIAASSPVTATVIAQATPTAPRRWLLLGLMAGLAVAAITGIVAWHLHPAPVLPVTRTVVTLPADERLAPATTVINVPLALSPDGTQMVYVAQRGSDPPRMYVRAMNSMEDRPLAGTEFSDQPFFSPDGQWIGFVSGGSSLKKVPIAGGAVIPLCGTGASLRGASWGSGNRIIFGTTANVGLFQVSATGGTPENLTSVDTSKQEISHRWPEILPGGKAVLFVIGGSGNYDDGTIVVQRLDTGERKVLLQGGTFPHYVPTGHLIYYRAGTMIAVPFDLDRLEVKGSPAPVIEGVLSPGGNTGGAQFSISYTGALAYVPGSLQGSVSTLVWVDRRGVATPLKAAARSFGGSSGPRLSPDGQLVAIQVNEQKSDIWVYSISHETMTRLTFEGVNTIPGWTRDGKRVVYQSTKAGPPNLFWKLADGSGAEERMIPTKSAQYPGSFTPDGKTFLYAEIEPKTGRDIFSLSLDGERKPHVFLQTPYNETTPRLSPDGHFVAYVSDASGRNEVYVRPFPGPGGLQQVSTLGGTEMIWGANEEIFYRSGNKMMAVQVKTQPMLEIGKPQVLFEGPYLFNAGAGANYDVTPDGQRFLMLEGNDRGPGATQINVVFNWFEELKQRVPSGPKNM